MFGFEGRELRFERCSIGEGARHGVQGCSLPFSEQMRMHPVVCRNLR
jgi:hypothetical protein